MDSKDFKIEDQEGGADGSGFGRRLSRDTILPEHNTLRTSSEEEQEEISSSLPVVGVSLDPEIYAVVYRDTHKLLGYILSFLTGSTLVALARAQDFKLEEWLQLHWVISSVDLEVASELLVFGVAFIVTQKFLSSFLNERLESRQQSGAIPKGTASSDLQAQYLRIIAQVLSRNSALTPQEKAVLLSDHDLFVQLTVQENQWSGIAKDFAVAMLMVAAITTAAHYLDAPFETWLGSTEIPGLNANHIADVMVFAHFVLFVMALGIAQWLRNQYHEHTILGKQVAFYNKTLHSLSKNSTKKAALVEEKINKTSPSAENSVSEPQREQKTDEEKDLGEEFAQHQLPQSPPKSIPKLISASPPLTTETSFVSPRPMASSTITTTTPLPVSPKKTPILSPDTEQLWNELPASPTGARSMLPFSPISNLADGSINEEEKKAKALEFEELKHQKDKEYEQQRIKSQIIGATLNIVASSAPQELKQTALNALATLQNTLMTTVGGEAPNPPSVLSSHPPHSQLTPSPLPGRLPPSPNPSRRRQSLPGQEHSLHPHPSRPSSSVLTPSPRVLFPQAAGHSLVSPPTQPPRLLQRSSSADSVLSDTPPRSSGGPQIFQPRTVTPELTDSQRASTFIPEGTRPQSR